MDKLIAILLVVTSTLIGSFGSLLFKRSSSKTRFSFGLLKDKVFLFGFSLYALSSVFYIFALKFGDLSLVYPLVSLAYIWIIILSKILLDEKINKYKIAGTSFIILGVILIGVA